MKFALTLTCAALVVGAGTSIASATTATDRNYLIRGFNCIHQYEGAWNANTGNGYFGGLQMDWGFMKSYGAEYLRKWGTANNWPPSIQIAVAIKAHLSGRGWYPWPNTARYCGLL